MKDVGERLLIWAANCAVRLRLRPCDVFIGMSGIYLEASATARKRYQARILVERGSRHILSQKQILDDLAAKGAPTQRVALWSVRRELAHYELADLVVVPSL